MKKSTIILIIIFVVLIGVFYLSSKKEGKVKPGEAGTLFDIDSTQVSTIQLVKDQESVTLEKRGDEWFLSAPVDYRANQRYVEELVGNASHLRIESMVSDKPEKHGKFEVDSTGTEATIYAGGQSFAFVVGKASSDYSHSYVRKKDADEIYMVKGMIKRYYSKRLNDWRNRTIFDFDQETVDKLDVFNESGKTTFAKTDTGWVVHVGEESFVADEDKVNRLLRSLSSMRASDFRDEKPKTEEATQPEKEEEEEMEALDFSKPDVRVEMSFDFGGFEALSGLPETDEKQRCFVKKDGDDTVFIVYKSALTHIMKPPKEFKQADPEE